MNSFAFVSSFCFLFIFTISTLQAQEEDTLRFPNPGEKYEWKYWDNSEPYPSPDEFQRVDVNPEVIKTVAPKFPESMKQKKISLTVYLHVLISENGGIMRGQMDIKTYKAHQDFADAAIEAVKQWQFSPARTDGKPVKVWVMVPIKFTY